MSNSVSRRRRGVWVATLALIAFATLAVAAQAAGEKRARPPREPRPSQPTVPPLLFPDSLTSPTAPLDETMFPKLSDAPRRKTLAYDLLKLGQSVHVRSDEVVRGDVIVLGGDLRIEGQIDGGAVVVGGTIDLGPVASVAGDVIALGGHVEQASGAVVRGGVVGLSILPRPSASGADWARAQRIAVLVGHAIELAVLFAWTGLVAFVLGRRLQVARTWLRAAPWRTTGLGVLALTGGLFAVIMGIVLLAITLVGLPLSLILAVCTLLLLFVGLALGVVRIGEVFCDFLHLPSRHRFAAVTFGVVVLALPQIGADLVRLQTESGSGPLRVLHAALVVLAIASGLGALVLSRLGQAPFRPSDPAPRSAVAAIASPT